MNSVTLPGSTPCVIPNLSRFLARLDRLALEAVAQAAIDQLDKMDGDPDREANGDEFDGNLGEDELVDSGGFGPGCPLADSGVGDRGTMGMCGEYGIDQSNLVDRAAAFISLNEMNESDVDMAASQDAPMRLRLRGRLGLRHADRMV